MHRHASEALMPLLFGQAISLTLSSAYIFNQLTNQIGIYSSLFPNELMYHSLFLICLFKLKEIRIRLKNASKTVWCLWVALGIIDIVANTAMLKAFQYTSGVSAVLISSTSAIFTVPLSYIFLQARYNTVHGMGIFLVLLGLAMINYTKYNAALANGESESFELVGSALATLAALGFACTTVIQTKIIMAIDHGYPWASLSSYGIVSSIFSAIVANGSEFGQQDRDSLLYSTNPKAWFISGLILSSFAFYLLVPLYLQRFSAVNLQISILTADIGVYIFNVFYLKTKLSPLYIAGFSTVLFGLVVFNLAFLRQGKDTILIMK